MALNFILIDDQKTVLESTSSFVKNFIAENGIEAQISLCTTSPQDVLNYSSEKFDQMNVYILDINLKSEMNGLALGRAIRDREPNSYIIFLTAYIELSMMVFKYKLKVFDFLVKPVSYAELSECLKALVEDYSRILGLHLPAQENFINLKSGYQENYISINDIIYIESFGPKLRIHTVDEQFECYGTLKAIEKSINEMTDTFCRSHKSFLINTKYIREVNIKDLAVFMSNGDKCLVSRSKKKFLRSLPLNNS